MIMKYVFISVLLLFAVRDVSPSTGYTVVEHVSESTTEIVSGTIEVSEIFLPTTSESPHKTIENETILNYIQIWQENDFRGIRLECKAVLTRQEHTPALKWLRNTVYVSDRNYLERTEFHYTELGWIVRSSLSSRRPPFLPGSYACQVERRDHDGHFKRPLIVQMDVKKFGYNETCTKDVDCKEDMMCNFIDKVCFCGPQKVYIPGQRVCKQASAYAQKCESSAQCQYYDRNSICYDFTSSCRCQIGFQPIRTDKIRCVPRTEIIKPARRFHQDIYKAALVALISFTVIVIGLFLYSLCTRSLMRRARAQTPIPIDDQYTSDVFNVTDGVAAMRQADKPPTYQEIVVQDQMVLIPARQGVPPPAYNEALARSRNERLASILANMVINSQMEELASRRTANGQLSSSETSGPAEPAPTRSNGANTGETTVIGSSTTRLIEAAGPPRSINGIANPSFETDA